MRKLLYLSFIILASHAHAQEKPEVRSMHYFFSLNSGMLAGKSGESITYTVNTIHGIAVGKHLRAGLGIGYDSYDPWQTAPVFGSLEYGFWNKQNGNVFIQVNYGWSHTWLTKQETGASMDSWGGKMFNAMMGYRIKSGNLNVSIAAGYKYQYVTGDQIFWYNRNLTIYPGYGERTEGGLERFVFTLGIGWR